MNDYCYKPSGELQGDTKPMRDKGTATGVHDTYGADLSPDATNSMGGISGSTQSDKAKPHDGVSGTMHLGKTKPTVKGKGY